MRLWPRTSMVALISLSLVCSIAEASIQKAMNGFLATLSDGSNITKPSAYKDQAAGYYTGGSLFMRNSVHNTNLASIRMPGYKAGCGGIDMHFGALSFISSQEFTKALRSITSSMGSYALLLAIESYAPSIKNIMSELNEIAQKINQANINNCEIAATTLGAVLPKSDTANKHLCTMIGSEQKYGGFSDYAAARQGCGAGGKRGEVLNAGEKNEKYQKMLGGEFNLAWKAIQENEFLRKDQNLAEFFMTVSGTIIAKKKKDAEGAEIQEITTKASLADHASLLAAMLYGGNTSKYVCADAGDASKCLALTKSTMTINPGEGLVVKIRNTLIAIQEKIYQDQALTTSEIAFLNSTKLPFYKILNVATAYRRGASPIDIADYSELAAVDVLFKYLTEILDIMTESTDHLKLAQVDDTHVQRFQEGLAAARKRVIERRSATFKEVEQIFAVLRRTEMMEQMIATKLGALASGGI